MVVFLSVGSHKVRLVQLLTHLVLGLSQCLPRIGIYAKMASTLLRRYKYC